MRDRWDLEDSQIMAGIAFVAIIAAGLFLLWATWEQAIFIKEWRWPYVLFLLGIALLLSMEVGRFYRVSEVPDHKHNESPLHRHENVPSHRHQAVEIQGLAQSSETEQQIVELYRKVADLYQMGGNQQQQTEQANIQLQANAEAIASLRKSCEENRQELAEVVKKEMGEVVQTLDHLGTVTTDELTKLSEKLEGEVKVCADELQVKIEELIRLAKKLNKLIKKEQ